MSLTTSSTIGRYEIVRELGHGAMGVVYEARDPVLDRTVALKVIKPAAEGDELEAYEERFLAEARIAAQLQHPGIVVVHDVGRDEASGTLFIALELLRGQTLAELARAGAGGVGARDAHRRPGRARARLRARARRRAPRHQAGQRDRAALGRGQGDRLRHRAARERAPAAHLDRRVHRDAALHGPRAGARRGRRRPRRRLLARLGGLHAARGPAALHGAQHPGHRAPRGVRRARAARALRAGASGGRRARDGARDGEGPGRALSHRGSVRRGRGRRGGGAAAAKRSRRRSRGRRGVRHGTLPRGRSPGGGVVAARPPGRRGCERHAHVTASAAARASAAIPR